MHAKEKVKYEYGNLVLDKKISMPYTKYIERNQTPTPPLPARATTDRTGDKMPFLVVDPAGVFIRAPWGSEEQFQDRVEQARERSERLAERREEFRNRFREITGKDALE